MKAINPKGTGHGGEYQSEHTTGPQGRKVPLSKGQSPKGSMIDGPFGGKVKA